MITKEEAEQHIGDGVVYRARYSGATAEDGTITSVNDHGIFVRYKGDLHSKMTSFEDLEFLLSKPTSPE